MTHDWSLLLVAGDRYASHLDAFKGRYQLPDEWFAQPDHLAVKCRDKDDYRQTVDDAKAYGTRITEIEMDGRHLATVELAEPILLGPYGSVSWLEIMEPRPEKVGKDVIGTDHAEFFFPDFEAVEAVLQAKGVPYQRQSNPSHSWVSLALSRGGPELKLNDGLLAEAVTHEINEGLTKVLWKKFL